MPSKCRWRGNAPSVAQVDRVTIHHVEAGVIYTLTNGGKTVSYTATNVDTLTTVMSSLAALWNAAIEPQFAEITAAASVGTLTLTAKFAGVPFDAAVSQTGTGGNYEVKTVTIGHSPTGGTWSWVDSTYGTVSGLAYNISAASLQTALETPYGAGNVTVAGSNGGPFTVTFAGTLIHVNIPDTSFVATTLTGGDSAVQVVETVKGAAGIDEVQTITFYGSPSGGTFTASFNGALTSDLAYNISSADFQTALRALPSINGANVTVSGSAGGPYTVTFTGTLAGTAVDPIVIDALLLAGGTIFGTVSTTIPGVAGVNERQVICFDSGSGLNEVVSLERSGTVSGGTFRLSYGSGAGKVYTDNLAYDLPLYQILEAFETVIHTKEGSQYRGPYFAPLSESTANLSIGAAGGHLLVQMIADRGSADADTSGGNSNDLGIDGALLTGGGSYSFPGTTYSSDGSGGSVGSIPTSGTFRLRFGGQFTSLLTFAFDGLATVTSPTAAQVQTALESLSTIGTGNVTVTAFHSSNPGSPPYGSQVGGFLVDFIGAKVGTPLGEIDGVPDVMSGTIPCYTLRNGSAGTNEVQSLTLSGTPSQGTFTLTFHGETTAPIAYNASAADVQTALIALTSIDAGAVVCTGGALPGTPVTITFSGALQYTNVSQITINDNNLKVLVVETTAGVTSTNEIQTVTLTNSPFSGTATLTYSGQTTSALQWNSTASDVQAGLIALSNLAPGDVVCTGGPWPLPIACTFGGALAATDVAAMTGTPTLNNGTVTSTSIDPMTVDVVTANSGPGDIAVAANWSSETLPVAGDTVIIDQGSSPMLYHLDQLATGLAGFDLYARYTGQIGLPEVQRNFGTPYYEFRPQYLVVDAPEINIGTGGGNGSGRVKIKGVTGTAVAVNVYKSDNSLDEGIEAVLLVLPNATSVLNVNRGNVGVAIYPGETSTVPTLRVGFETNQGGDSSVRTGAGVTLTTIEQSGGVLVTNSNVTTLNVTGGEYQHLDGTLTTANIDGGAVRYLSDGTLTTAILSSGGILDYRQDMRTKTLTNLAMNAGTEYHDPHGVVTLTNGADFVKCTPADCVFEVKPNLTWTPSVI